MFKLSLDLFLSFAIQKLFSPTFSYLGNKLQKSVRIMIKRISGLMRNTKQKLKDSILSLREAFSEISKVTLYEQFLAASILKLASLLEKKVLILTSRDSSFSSLPKALRLLNKRTQLKQVQTGTIHEFWQSRNRIAHCYNSSDMPDIVTSCKILSNGLDSLEITVELIKRA